MKQALIKWIQYKSEPSEHIYITTLEEVFDYISMVSKNTVNTLSHLIHNLIPKEKWDHYAQKGDYGNSFNIAMTEVLAKGEGNPIYSVDAWTQKKLLSMSEWIIQGKIIVVNSNGGWCLLDDTMHKVIEIYDFEPKENRHYKIYKDTQYLNLENDYELEKRTIEYLKPLDENFSYICGLRDYRKEDWLNIFKAFRQEGGHTIYVYTTGSDSVQMQDYCEMIIDSGITHIIFEFNAGMTEEIKDVLKYLSKFEIEVTLINQVRN